jgi:hypothetical protein
MTWGIVCCCAAYWGSVMMMMMMIMICFLLLLSGTRGGFLMMTRNFQIQSLFTFVRKTAIISNPIDIGMFHDIDCFHGSLLFEIKNKTISTLGFRFLKLEKVIF